MRKTKKTYLIIVILIIVLELIPHTRNFIGRGAMFVARPIFAYLSSWASNSRGLLYGLSEISGLKQENSRLAEKLKSIQVENVEIEELRYENEILKKQLGFLEERKDLELIPSRIVAREPFGALDKIIIDKGAKDSVKERSAVVSNGAIIGRISEVYEDQSKITLITSKDSIIQVMLQKSRTLGILKGSLDGVKMENIPQDTPIEEGEVIITSGLGGEIESGILVGWAQKEVSYKSEIFKILEIKIAEDLNKLEYVFVVK